MLHPQVHNWNWGENSPIKSLQEDPQKRFRLGQITIRANFFSPYLVQNIEDQKPVGPWNIGTSTHSTTCSISSVLSGRLLFAFHDSPTRIQCKMRRAPAFSSQMGLLTFQSKIFSGIWTQGNPHGMAVGEQGCGPQFEVAGLQLSVFFFGKCLQLSWWFMFFCCVVTLPLCCFTGEKNISCGAHSSLHGRWSHWSKAMIPRGPQIFLGGDV